MGPAYTIIADDFSGAAETGGVAVRHGLSAAVRLPGTGAGDEQVTILDTDTRRRPEEEVRSILGDVVLDSARVRAGGACLYKKVDSVLRGHVVLEVALLLERTGLPRALLVPSNPAAGRVIEDGIYSIRGVPIDETDFRNDPRHPARSSRVLELLGPAGSGPGITLVRPGEELPEEGIIVGEASRPEHLDLWARQLDERTMAAGAAAFLSTILARKGLRERVPAQRKPHGRQLVVSGSLSAVSRSEMQLIRRRGFPVVEMPPSLFRSGAIGARALAGWANDVIAGFEGSTLVAVTSGGRSPVDPARASLVADALAEVVRCVLGLSVIDHVWIEGGETASRIVRSLGWGRLVVRGEIQRAVVQLTADPRTRPVLNVKPGSYAWPLLRG